MGKDIYWDKRLVQTLKDAGCSGETIDAFLSLHLEGKTHESIRLLSKHKLKLLNTLHKNQKKIDVLDYLIYTLNKERSN